MLIAHAGDIEDSSNDNEKIKKLKAYLGTEVENKNLGTLKYFLGIEVANCKKGDCHLTL